MDEQRAKLTSRAIRVNSHRKVDGSSMLLFVTLVKLISTVNGFNLDVNTSVVHRGPTDSYYGFSVAQHRDRGDGWLLIGAPLAEGTQAGIIKGGAVFRCRSNAINTCQQIAFDERGPAIVRNDTGHLVQSESKANQWFGATLSSSGDTGKIIACAPRYVSFSNNYKRREPIGMCFLSTGSFIGIIPLDPCRKIDQWGYHKLGSCQFGFSATISQDGKRLFSGAVGSYYWQGQVYSIDADNTTNYHSSKEFGEKEDDTYLGYSVTSGHFTKENEIAVAVGRPKGNQLKGTVIVFSQQLGKITEILGEQLGSYFGFSLASADLNNDGLDDIVIGAPFYTTSNEKDTGYEQGGIYIAYQTEKQVFSRMSLIKGKQSRARFGLSLTRAGDLNLDGYQDIAVGAPYDGPAEHGAVYIFNGGPDGLKDKPSQIIYAEDLRDPGLRTFGYSLSGGMDMDRNQYPDLLVGAYGSDRAVHLNARPIVHIDVMLKVEPENIRLDNKGCSLNDGTKVACVLVNLCFNYTGINVGTKLGFLYEIRLDEETNQAPRAFLLNKQTKNVDLMNVELSKGTSKCDKFYAYLMENLRDKLNPIKVEIKYDIFDPFPERRILKPILNMEKENNISRFVEIQKDCGDDNVCVPDLKLTVNPNMDQYLIGSGKRLELDIQIENNGEDAFEAMMYLFMPLDINYVNFNKSKLDLPILCVGAQPEKTGSNVLECDIGNPLPAGSKVRFSVILEPSKIVSAAPDFTFITQVNSSNPELNGKEKDNEFVIGLPVRVEVNLTSTGASLPDPIVYSVNEPIQKTKSSEVDIGPQVFHIYQLQNRGPSTVVEAKVTILWPSRTLDNKHLLYLLDQPQITTGNSATGNYPHNKAFCQTITLDEVNPLRLPARRNDDINSTVHTFLSSERNRRSLLDEMSLSREKRHYRPVPSNKQTSSAYTNDGLTSCGLTLCTKIYCTITNLGHGEQVIFSVRSRLWKETIVDIGLNEFQISSKLISTVTKLPYDVDPSYFNLKCLRCQRKCT